MNKLKIKQDKIQVISIQLIQIIKQKEEHLFDRELMRKNNGGYSI